MMARDSEAEITERVRERKRAALAPKAPLQVWEIDKSHVGSTSSTVIFSGSHEQALKAWREIEAEIGASVYPEGTKFSLIDLSTEQARRFQVVANAVVPFAEERAA